MGIKGKLLTVGMWIVLAILLLIVCSQVAESQTYSYDNTALGLRTAVAYQLRTRVVSTRLLDTAKINLAVNRAVAEVCTQAPAFEKMDTLTVDSTAEGGTLPDDFVAMHEVYRISGDTIRWELMPRTLVKPQVATTIDPTDPASLNRLYPGLELHDRADLKSPSSYAVFGSTFILYPKYILNAVDSFLILYYAIDDELTTDTSNCLVDQRYMEAVVYYAAALCAATSEEFDKANWLMAQYTREMSLLPTFKGLEIR